MKKQAILLSVGLLCLAFWGMTRSGLGRPKHSGELVAEQPSIVWQGPSELSNEPAKVRFTLVNRGETAIRMIAVQSGCGCTVPSFDSGEIPPGGRGYVNAGVRYFPVGERRVPLIVQTNSPQSPTVNLALHLIGGASPPFLMKAEGDLSFMGEFDPTVSRDLVVHTIEAAGETKTPTFADLPSFLSVEPAGSTLTPYVLAGTLDRKHRFKVAFTSPPPESPYQGEFFILDPWNPARKERVGFLATVVPRVKVVPSRLSLTLEQGGGKVEGRLVVLSQQPLGSIKAAIEGATDSPLRVIREGVEGPSQRTTFRVEVDPSRPMPGDRVEFSIGVTWADGSQDGHLSVPVTLNR